MDAYIQKQVAAKKFSGSVLVHQAGKPILVKGYGLANAELGVPNKPETKFRLGSITKQFTAAAVLKLEDQGKLAVTDPLSKFLDELPEPWRPITIHQLLSHTSGIPNVTELPGYRASMRQRSSPMESAKRVADKPLDFDPGAKFKYSNTGYILLGAVIEKASGMTYAEYLKKNILDPAGMADTGYDDPALILANRASGYRAAGAGNAEFIDMSIPHAAGALYSTVLDLSKWHVALKGETLLSKASKEKMYTPVLNDYAYGWSVKTEPKKLYDHGGGINGFATMIGRFPDDDVVVVVLSNYEGGAAQDIARKLGGRVFGVPIVAPEDRKEQPADTAHFANYLGEYELSPLLRNVITTEGGKLYSKLGGQPRVELYQEAKDKFFLKVVDAQVQFTRDGSGKVTALVIHQNGRDVVAPKVN